MTGHNTCTHQVIFEEFGEYFAELLPYFRIIITFCYIMYNAIVLLIYKYFVVFVFFLSLSLSHRTEKGESVVMKITMDLTHTIILLAAVVYSASAYSSK